MSKTIRILIVEDEIVIAEDIRQSLEAVGYQVLGVARNYENAIKVLDLEKPDLLLLDITLKGDKTGIDVAKYVNEQFGIPFIFITSHANKTTLDSAIATNPYAYLVKPFNQDDLFTSIELALHKYNGSEAVNENTKVVQDKVVLPFLDSIFVKSGGVFKRLRLDDILFLEADGGYTNLYGAEQKFTERQILLEFEKRLPPEKFMRIHRSYIVNINKLEGLKQDKVIIGKTEVPLGRTYRDKLLQLVSR